MVSPAVNDDTFLQRYEAYLEHGSYTKAGKALGVGANTIRRAVVWAERKGLTGRAPPSPEGFEIRHLKEQVGKDGELKGQSVSYVQSPDVVAKLPEGAVLKKATIKSGPDGRVETQWSKYDAATITPEYAAKIIKGAFENFTPFAPAIIRNRNHDEDKLTLYVLADWHVGMFAWGKETDGHDWDLSIARKVLTDTFAELVEISPPSKHAIILGLGDLMHADSHKNMTPASGNIMDVDTRYAKVLPTVCDILVSCSEMVRTKHQIVEAEIKAGNHDTSSTVGIRSALRMFYRNDKRVIVNDSPSPFFWKRFGVNLLCGTHGDGVKARSIPLTMANIRAQDWAETKSKHAHTGHLHNEFTFEEGGVKVHQHRAPIPQDAWHHANGYRSGRSMRAFHYHKERGARGSSEVEIL